ncbi:MAG: DUF504 domain-containing protein [Candidatus Natronoplasma sp.]
MKTPRDVLNELKWREKENLDEARIYYVHRGAPADFRTMQGSEIEDLGRSFIKCVEGHIPYHRIFKIEYEGEVIFERER